MIILVYRLFLQLCDRSGWGLMLDSRAFEELARVKWQVSESEMDTGREMQGTGSC